MLSQIQEKQKIKNFVTISQDSLMRLNASIDNTVSSENNIRSNHR